MRIIFFTNIVSPYRVSLFNELEIIRNSYDFDFEVYFMRETESNRNWAINLEDLKFKHVIGNGFYANFFGLFWHFNPVLIYKLIRSGDEIVLGASWNNLNVMSIVLLKKAGLIKNRLSVWSEANYLTLGSQRKNRLRDCVRKWFFSGINGSFILPGKMAVLTFKKWDIDIRNVVFLPNLISAKSFPAKLIDSEIYKSVKPVFIIVARLEERLKGILNFIRSIGIENIRKIELRIIGEGSSINDYRHYVRHNKIEDSVFFFGNMSQVQVSQQYRNADIFVLPSFSDPSPLTVVEALHSGLPLLISERCGNHFEAVENGYNGYTFNPYNSLDIKEKFELILTQKQLWNSFSLNSSKIAGEQFNAKKVLHNLIHNLQYAAM